MVNESKNDVLNWFSKHAIQDDPVVSGVKPY